MKKLAAGYLLIEVLVSLLIVEWMIMAVLKWWGFQSTTQTRQFAKLEQLVVDRNNAERLQVEGRLVSASSSEPGLYSN